MIDLHAHVLPGVDDGPPNLETAVALCAAMRAAGTRVVAATSHVNTRYGLDPSSIPERVEALQRTLGAEGVELTVVTGAELDIGRLPVLDDEQLATCALGGGDTLLVESPYAAEAPFLEDALFGVQARGFRVLLAHPERSPLFQAEPRRLHDLVDRGVLVSLTASAFGGRFGRRVQRFACELVAAGVVHNIASDAHDLRGRPPELEPHLEAADDEVPGIFAAREFFLESAPAALLDGSGLTSRPPELGRPRRRGFLRRGR